MRQAVARATLDLLKDGKAHFSAAAVAGRTGVHRSTVYRRWPTRAELLQEALTLHTSRIEIPDKGSWRRDVHALAKNLAEFFSDPVEMGMNAAMAANVDPEFTKWVIDHWNPVLHELTRPVERAMARGEVPTDVNPRLLTVLLFSPILLGTLLRRAPLDPDTVRTLAETFVRLSSNGSPNRARIAKRR